MAEKPTTAATAASSTNLFIMLGVLAFAVIGMVVVIATAGPNSALGFSIPAAVG